MGVPAKLAARVRQHRTLALIAGGVILLLGTCLTTFLLTRPKQYLSESVLSYTSAVGQSPEGVGQPGASMAQTALDNEHLSLVMSQLDLYPELRRKQPEDTVLAHMRADISVQQDSRNALTLGFKDADRLRALAVTNALAEVLSTFALDARGPLLDHPSDTQLPALPPASSVQQSNPAQIGQVWRRIGRLNAMIAELSTDQAALQEESTATQNKIAALGDRSVVRPSEAHNQTQVVDPAAPTRAALSQQLQTEKLKLASLRERYTEAYPDVQNAEQLVSQLEAKLAALPPPIAPSVKTVAPPTLYESQIDKLTIRESQLGEQLRSNARQLQDLKRSRDALKLSLLSPSLSPSGSSALTQAKGARQSFPIAPKSSARPQAASVVAVPISFKPFQVIKPATSSVQIRTAGKTEALWIAFATLILLVPCLAPFIPTSDEVITSAEDLRAKLPENVAYLGHIRRIEP